MSLKSKLEESLKNLSSLAENLPTSQEKRKLEISLDQAQVALENLPEDLEAKNAKKKPAKQVKKTKSKTKAKTDAEIDEELVPLGSTIPFSEADLDRIGRGEDPKDI